MSNKLIKIAREILAIEDDLPYRIKYNKEERATVDDFTMYTFTQLWGSTALGFGGIGGQAMTTANTYVFIPEGVDQDCFIYFGARFAYNVPYSQVLMNDVCSHNMESVSRSGKYKREVTLSQNEYVCGINGAPCNECRPCCDLKKNVEVVE